MSLRSQGSQVRILPGVPSSFHSTRPVLGAIFKLVFIILLFQGAAFLLRMLRGGSRRAFSQKEPEERVKKPDYGDLTPYDIEDAEFEELPEEKKD